MLFKQISYDIECGMELFTVCNYKCKFCSGPKTKKLSRRGRTREDVSKIIEFFQETDKTWLLGFSGGEPSIHPFFAELVTEIQKRHYLYFFTNLSFDVQKFMKLARPERVQYMKTSLHPEADIDVFMEKYELLLKNDYNPILIMVSAPDTFDRIERVAAICRQKQYPFTLSTMEGPYNDQNYPQDYTDQETAFIEKHLREPGNLVRLFSKTAGGANTYGMRCRAGRASFSLDLESGDFRTCESVGKLHGNIYEGTFQASPEDILCPAINGCVGYDRHMYLPEAYGQFYENSSNYWRGREVQNEPGYPKNLYDILRADTAKSSKLISQALNAVLECIGNSKTLFWGAGIYGGKILHALRELHGDSFPQVVGFIDALKERHEMSILNLPVYSPHDPKVYEAEKIVITSFAFEKDIAIQAAELGLASKILPLHSKLLNPMGIKGGIF